MKSLSTTSMLILAGYLLVLAGVIGGLFYARHWAKETLMSKSEFAAWQTWRKEAQRQADGEGPVKRRVPKAQAPPALILTQDYFVEFQVIAVLLTSALYFTLAFMIRGAIRSPGVIIEDPPPQNRTAGDDFPDASD